MVKTRHPTIERAIEIVTAETELTDVRTSGAPDRLMRPLRPRAGRTLTSVTEMGNVRDDAETDKVISYCRL